MIALIREVENWDQPMNLITHPIIYLLISKTHLLTICAGHINLKKNKKYGLAPKELRAERSVRYGNSQGRRAVTVLLQKYLQVQRGIKKGTFHTKGVKGQEKLELSLVYECNQGREGHSRLRFLKAWPIWQIAWCGYGMGTQGGFSKK